MPNWVTNQIQMRGEYNTRAKVAEFISDKNGEVDFNNIVQMPPEICDTEAGTSASNAWDYYECVECGNESGIRRTMSYPWAIEAGVKELEDMLKIMRERDPKIYDTGKKLHEIHEQYGYHDWYEWSCANWGTKWNASESEVSEGYISFNTAWSDVHDLIQKLSCLFPTIEFEYAWADEDYGANLGRITYKGGEIIAQNIPQDGSAEALAMAEEILGYSIEEEEE